MDSNTIVQYPGGYSKELLFFTIPFGFYSIAILIPYQIVIGYGFLLPVISIIPQMIGFVFVIWSNIGLFTTGRGGSAGVFF